MGLEILRENGGACSTLIAKRFIQERINKS